jgi:glutaredoxin-like protein NrdH
MITVYSKPACVQCTATTRELDRKGIAYNYVDLTKDAGAMEKVQGLGYMQAPVVTTENDHWSGFRPDKISQLVEQDVLKTA